MANNTNKLHIVKNIRPVVSAFTTAARFMRSMSIKRFTPQIRYREFSVLQKNPDSIRMRCQLFREKGGGNVPTILPGGFVPGVPNRLNFSVPC